MLLIGKKMKILMAGQKNKFLKSFFHRSIYEIYEQTTVQVFINNLILFSKDSINWSEMTVNSNAYIVTKKPI